MINGLLRVQQRACTAYPIRLKALWSKFAMLSSKSRREEYLFLVGPSLVGDSSMGIKPMTEKNNRPPGGGAYPEPLPARRAAALSCRVFYTPGFLDA